MCWRSSPDRERPMVRLKRSTAGLNICAGLLWGSVTSPTTSPGVCSSPVASDRFYTLNYDEPVCRGHERDVDDEDPQQGESSQGVDIMHSPCLQGCLGIRSLSHADDNIT